MAALARRWRAGLAAAALGAATAGCTGLAAGPTGAERAAVFFDAPAFAGIAPARSRFRDARQREEYVLFRGRGAQAEMVYLVADEQASVALDYGMSFRADLASWSFIAGRAKEFGQAGHFWNGFAIVYYLPFTLEAKRRHCFAFTAAWDQRVDDPKLRPARVLFGYYCARTDQALTDAGIRGLIGRIAIAGVTEHAAEAVAAGAGAEAAGRTGNRDFPFRLGRYFGSGGSDPRSAFN